MNQLFLDIFFSLPRQGPGDPASTRRAFQSVKAAGAVENILDIGCGVGTQTMDLARISDAPIVTLDFFRIGLDVLAGRVREKNLQDRIAIVHGDMNSLPFKPGSFDLVWSEGAIFVMGFQNGLREWRRYLRPRGFMAITELAWIAGDPPPELQEFWDRQYPAITGIEENISILEKCGYRLLDRFILPEDAWWKDLYLPLEKRVEEARKIQRDEESREILDRMQEEIEIYRRFSKYYGYVFFVMQKMDL